jgi:hypothetical protein
MAKSKKVRTTKQENKSFFSKFSFNDIVPQKYQFAFYLAIPVTLFLIFFAPLYFGGKSFYSGDIISIISNKTYLQAEREGYTLWNPYVFCGMPAYAIAIGFKWFNLNWLGLEVIHQIFSLPFENDYSRWTMYLIILSYSSFFLFYNLTKDKLTSLLVAITTGFSTGLVVFLYIGHVTKLTSLAFYPIIFLMLFNFQNKIRIMDFFLLIIILNLCIMGWHVQIIFYTLFAVAIFLAFFFLYSLSKKNIIQRNQTIKSAVVFIFAMLFAVAIQADNLSQIYEYTPASTRGTKSILEETTQTTAKSESDFYQYATNWSFSPGEVLTFIIPSYYGFGKSTYDGPLTDKPVEVNTYFGQMPFVDIAMYMGVLVFFFAVFSMIVNWKNPVVKFLTILSVISLLISFGRTFPVLYDLMFHYFPFFDKFRVPSMILVIVQISFPVLAGFGILRIIQLKDQPDKKVESVVKYSFIVFVFLFLISFLFESSLKDGFISRVNESGQRGTQLRALHDYMSGMFISDFRFAFFISAAAFGLAFAFIKNVVSRDILLGSIILLTVIDLFRINHRGETYVDNAYIEQLFSKPVYINAIEGLNDNSVYRLLNMKRDGSMGSVNQNSNFNAYFLKQDLYGYSGIKPRAYQDYMDVIGSPINPTLWRMLNTKYIIFDNEITSPDLELKYSGANTFVYENKAALPRAYFVNRVENKPAIETINSVKNNLFDPKEVAYLTDETISVEPPDTTAYVEIARYTDEKITLKAKASGNNFLFIGDNYVPKGWTALIDGTETKIYKVNHGFRGIVVPEGEHTITFTYLPESWVIAKNLALGLSSLAIAGVFFGMFLIKRKSKKQIE